ncbi:MAG: trypsin-like peptidase domain-containing protein [Verrucomicrobiota bacterium]
MNPAFRRLLALVAVFVTAFVAVTVLRTLRSGGDLRDIIPGFGPKSGQFHPEAFTLPDKAPLELSEMELLSRLNNEYAKLTEAVVPSVVSIDTTGIRSERLYDVWSGGTQIRNYPTQGQGSGVIVTREGHLMTNHHVIDGQKDIRVTLHGGKTYTAHLIGEDVLLDIAVLKIDATETFTPLKLGDSAQVKVGQIVMAVGNPFGLGETVTQGIISAKERSLSDNQRDLFQTDASINPGNSGGPLVNLRGEIIGINVAIYSDEKEPEKQRFRGVGFSIPSNDVKDSLFQILERGRPIRGFLGVQMHDLDPGIRSALGYPDDSGAVVLGVSPGSPAQAAGLQPWDIVRSVNDEKIRSSTQLLTLVQRSRVGTEMALDVWRKGESVPLKATIAESGLAKPLVPKQSAESGQGRTPNPDEVLRALGIQVRELSGLERQRGFRGAVVTGIADKGLAAGHVKAGDLILEVNNSPINSASEFLLHLAASAAVQDTALQLLRDGQIVRVNLAALPRQQ